MYIRNGTGRPWNRIAKTVVPTIAVALLLIIIPSGIVIAQDEPRSVSAEVTLERLSNLVQRLEAELAASRNPVAERLEERLEAVAEGLERLLDLIDRPQVEEDAPALKRRILQFDLTMHRLLHLLEEMIEQPSPLQHGGAREAFEGLRRWMDGYIAATTAGIPDEQARRFEVAAQEAMRDLVRQLAAMARRVQADTNTPSDTGLPRLVERLEMLVFRLDGFILGHLPGPARPQPRPREP